LNDEEMDNMKAALKAIGPMMGLEPDTINNLFKGADEISKEGAIMKNQLRVLTVWASRHDKEGLMQAREVVRNAEKAEGDTA